MKFLDQTCLSILYINSWNISFLSQRACRNFWPCQTLLILVPPGTQLLDTTPTLFTLTSSYVPLQIIFGLPVQICLLLAFYKQTKKTAYWYQFVLGMRELLVFIARCNFLISLFRLSGYHESAGVTWFMTCYGCKYVIGTVLLILFNAVVVALYRKYLRKAEQMGNTNEAKWRRNQEKTLSVLAIMESVSNTFSMGTLIVYYAWVCADPNFTNC